MNEPTVWTLHEAVAWMATGDMQLVEETRRRIDECEMEGKDGGLYAWLEFAVKVEELVGNNGRPPFTWAVDPVRERLRSACERGQVRASGIPHDRGSRRAVPRSDFVDAVLAQARGLALHRVIAGQTEPALWFELRFVAADVRTLSELQFDHTASVRRTLECESETSQSAVEYVDGASRMRLAEAANGQLPTEAADIVSVFADASPGAFPDTRSREGWKMAAAGAAADFPKSGKSRGAQNQPPHLVQLAAEWGGPDPIFRWNALQAIAWIATRDIRWVKGISLLLSGNAALSWGNNPRAADRAFETLRIALHRPDPSDGMVLSAGAALGQLLASTRGDLMVIDNFGALASVASYNVDSLRFDGADIGVGVASSDDRWRNIYFEASDIIDRWPGPEADKTGDPGRPSKSADVYFDEFERRVAAKQVLPMLNEEAAALLAWLKITHPTKPRPGEGTIRNRIRSKFREYHRTN